ncbi:YhbD family protein [Clostridium subterminale]|uniref:YhbD family protein n=1 Tax=Clostridium subterminale TaxID=1550 RepID=A0ABN1KPI6_CLOSU
MEEELISKKEILDMTGISYGQLYRWKRKELIPEEWFIKKSSYTGQETFFPREKIINRINKIIELKDDMPLDDLAAMFTNKPKVDDVSEEYVIEKEIIREETLPIYKDIFREKNEYNFKDILLMHILQSEFDLGKLTISEIEIMLKLIDKEYRNIEEKDGTLYIIRRLGIGICVVAYREKIIVDDGSKIIGEVNIKNTIENIKMRLTV